METDLRISADELKSIILSNATKGRSRGEGIELFIDGELCKGVVTARIINISREMNNECLMDLVVSAVAKIDKEWFCTRDVNNVIIDTNDIYRRQKSMCNSQYLARLTKNKYLKRKRMPNSARWLHRKTDKFSELLATADTKEE